MSAAIFAAALLVSTGVLGEDHNDQVLREAENDLLVLVDFDGSPTARTSWGTAVRGVFTRDSQAALWDGVLVDRGKPRFLKGKYGSGIYLERQATNFYYENQSNVEAGVAGFLSLGEAKLSQSTDDHWQGRASLAVLARKGGGLETEEVPTLTVPLHGHEPVRIFAASVFLKGERGGERLSLELLDVASLQEAAPRIYEDLTKKAEQEGAPPEDDVDALLEDEQEEEGTDPSRSPETASPFDPKSEKQQIALSREWKRYVARVSLPRQRVRHRFRFRVVSEDEAPVRFLADGFQLEQSGQYPHYHVATTWVPGRTERAAETLAFSLDEIRFPEKEGAVSAWVNPRSWWGAAELGACAVFSIGAVNQPAWLLPQSYRVTVKGGSAFFNVKHRPVANRFHHFLLNWDEDRFELFINGRSAATGKVGGKPITTRLLHVGLAASNLQNANSVIDELAIFRRPLTAGEVEAIHGSPRPLRLGTAFALEALQERWVFFRDETNAALRFRVHHGPAHNKPAVRAELLAEGHPVPGIALEAKPDPAGDFALRLSPRDLTAREYLVRLKLSDDKGEKSYSYPVTVVPALNARRYLTQIWQGPIDEKNLDSFGEMGLSILDTSRWASDRTLMDRLARRGIQLCAHFGTLSPISSLLHPEACIVRQDGKTTRRLCANHPKVVQASAEHTQHRLRVLKPYPHVTFCLLNSEVNNQPCFAESCMQRMKADLGFTWPDKLRTGSGGRILFNAKEEPAPHVVDGIVKDDDAYYATFQWRHGPGSLSPHHQAVSAALKETINAKVVHDPAFRLPWVHTRSEGVDVIQHWSYSPAQEVNLLSIKGLLCDARGQKPTSLILGMVWPRASYEKDGKKVSAAQSPDYLRESMWLVLSQPVDLLSFWAWGEKPPPGHEASFEEVRRMFREVVRPYGPAIRKMKAVPNAAATLYSACSQLFYQYPWFFTWGYTRTFNQTLLKHNVPLDVIYEQDVLEGALDRYEALFLPVNVALPESVHREIVKFAGRGKLVVADKFLKAAIPGVHQLDIHLGTPSYLAPAKAIVDRVSAYCPEIKKRLQPYVDTSTPDIFVAAKQYDGVRYVFVINDKRHAGESMDYTGDPKLAEKHLPDGLAQTAEIAIRTPGSPVIYDVLSQRTVPYDRDGETLALSLPLGPSEGKLLAVYREAIGKVAIAVGGDLRRGGRLQVEVTVLAESGKPMPGAQPIQLDILDSPGRRNDYSDAYATDHGLFRLEIPVALNEPAGRWKATVRELTTGRTVSTSFVVK